MLRTHLNCVTRSLISDPSEPYQAALSTFALTCTFKIIINNDYVIS